MCPHNRRGGVKSKVVSGQFVRREEVDEGHNLWSDKYPFLFKKNMKKIRICLECDDYFTVFSINLLIPVFVVVLLKSTRLSIFPFSTH